MIGGSTSRIPKRKQTPAIDDKKQTTSPAALTKSGSATKLGHTNSSKKPRTEWDNEMKTAEDCRQSLLQRCGHAQQLLSAIEHDKAWDWGKTQHVQGVLRQQVEAIDKQVAALPEPHKSFIMGCTLADLEKEYGEDSVKAAVKAIPDCLTIKLDELSQSCDNFSAMHMIYTKTNKKNTS